MTMRAILPAVLGLALLTVASSAQAGPLPPLPDVPLPDVPLPEIPAVSAGCVDLVLVLGTAGVLVDAPACHVGDNALPDPDPVGAEFPAAPDVPLPEPPALPPLPDLPVPQ